MTPISELAQRIVKIVDDEGYYDREAAGAEVDQYVLTPIRECFDALLMRRRPDRSPCWCLVGLSDIRIAAGQPEHTEACQRVRELYPKLEIGTSSIATPVAATGDDEGDRTRCASCRHPFCKDCYEVGECCKCDTTIPPRTVAEQLAQHEHIDIVSGVLGGVTPVVSRTRIGVHHILTYLYNGNSIEYIADTYRLSPEAIKDAIAFAQEVYDDAVSTALRTQVEGESK